MEKNQSNFEYEDNASSFPTTKNVENLRDVKNWGGWWRVEMLKHKNVCRFKDEFEVSSLKQTPVRRCASMNLAAAHACEYNNEWREANNALIDLFLVKK